MLQQVGPTVLLCYIWSSHSGNYRSDCLPECDAMWSGRQVPNCMASYSAKQKQLYLHFRLFHTCSVSSTSAVYRRPTSELHVSPFSSNYNFLQSNVCPLVATSLNTSVISHLCTLNSNIFIIKFSRVIIPINFWGVQNFGNFPCHHHQVISRIKEPLETLDFESECTLLVAKNILLFHHSICVKLKYIRSS